MNTSIVIFFESLFQTLKSLIKTFVFGLGKKSYKYKLRTRQEVVFILGSGISLKKDISHKIDQLSKQDVFVTNQFVLSDFFLQLKPHFYILADPCYWGNNISDAEECLVYKVVNGLKKNVNWKISLFVPYIALNSERIGILKTNSYIKVIGYSAVSLNGFCFCRNYWYKRNLGMPPPQTVLNASVFLALNSGYKNINILGADHTWIKQLSVGYDNLIYYEDNHFYDKEKARKVAFVDGDNKDWTIEKWLLSVAKMFQSHYVLKDYGIYLGAKIYNLTSDTLLDVYDRKKLDDVL